MVKKKIFLASSSELKEDRDAFRLLITEKNNEWATSGIYLETIVWEEFLDAVSLTRSQDEYNEAIEACDLFVLLFFTKVGKYTEEEFDKAYQHFKAAGKPLLFTYFKNADIKTAHITKEVLSLLNFKEKLSKMEHFYAVYENIGDLKYDFSSQLDKLAMKDFFEVKLPTGGKVNTGGVLLPKELTNTLPKTDPRDIVGREEDLKQLHELLTTDQRVVVVNGLGGIGKTTLAQTYVSTYYGAYKHILWITQSSENLASDFINAAGLVQNLGIDAAGLQPEQVFEEIIRKLKIVDDQPNLLVIDNSEQSLSNYKDTLPGQPLWHLLMTSRENIDGFYHKQLDFLSEDQAIQLFKKYYSRQTLKEQEIRELVQAVDYHTLTIEILAKTAEVQRSDVNTLKEAIQDNIRANVKIAREKQSIERIGSYLTTVFNCSRLNETEIWIMKQLACLPPEYQPYHLLQELIIDEESPYRDIFSETLDSITKKGWLLYNNTTDSYKMHRIIAEVVKKQHPVSIGDVKSLISKVTGRIRTDFNIDDPVDKFIWIPYCTSILANFTEDASKEMALLQNTLATILEHLGRYEEAKMLYEKAVKAYEEIYGAEHIDTITVYSNLASVLRRLKRYKETQELLERTIELAEKSLGKDHAKTTLMYSTMAFLLKDQGYLEEAKELMEKVVESDERNYGFDHPSTALTYYNQSNVFIDLKQYDEAKKLLEKAIKIYEQKSGKDHVNTALMYNNMAATLFYLDNNEKAFYYIEKTLRIFNKSLPKDHSYVKNANSWYDLIKSKMDRSSIADN